MRLKEKNQLKLISFLIAILLFISVNQNFRNLSVVGVSDNTATAWVTDVPLEVDYDRDKLYVVGIPNTVSVKISGSPSKVQKESVAKNFKAKLNLKNAQIGDDQKVKLEVEGLDKSLEGTVEPNTITISIREKVTKEFKVTPIVRKERLLIGYEIDKLSVTNETVKISGDADSINRIKEVRAESETRTKINKNIKEEVKLIAYDSDYNKIDDVQIDPGTTVMSIDLKNVEKEVPIQVNTVGNLPQGYELVSVTPDVSKVTVRAETQSDLDKINEMYVDVDLSDIKEETEERSNLKIYSKEDVRVAADTPIVKVTIKVKKR
ncbi:CdaR family protein [Gemella cuniculi]|uniref:CdaR family protein n=1 Tax=Gemella cuniculi TaxID=150240 RepID=UPI00041575BC|nr:CdaR family protein [Gemella cuniculi]